MTAGRFIPQGRIKMDDADRVTERMEREEALRRMFKPKNEIEPRGTCYYCEADVEPPKKFCNSECSEGWEFERRMTRVGK